MMGIQRCRRARAGLACGFVGSLLARGGDSSLRWALRPVLARFCARSCGPHEISHTQHHTTIKYLFVAARNDVCGLLWSEICFTNKWEIEVISWIIIISKYIKVSRELR